MVELGKTESSSSEKSTENLSQIIEYIKTLQTGEERKEFIIKLSDDIKMELINRIKEFSKEKQGVSNISGFRRISRTDSIDDEYVYSVIDSLSNENMLNFLKSKDDRFKVNFVIYAQPDDYIKLSLINMISDFPYKLLIAYRINDTELKGKIMSEIGVSDTFISMIKGNYELQSEEDIKYNSIEIPSELTLGIEIEGANMNYAEMLKQMVNLPGELLSWIWKGDYTIVEGKEADNGINYGLEVVSPILNDNLGAVQQIYTVCNMLQELGTEINSKCGGHIHLGIDYFKNPKELWNLIEIYGNCEEIFNLINNEKGTLPRDSLNRFAKSTYKKLLDANIDVNSFSDINEFIQEIKRIQYGKSYDVNISDHNTVEFRAPNGSVKPEIWIENIRLYGRLMEVAKGLEDGGIFNSEQKRNLYLQLKTQGDLSKKCDLLLELLFDNENDRKVFRERFDANRKLQINMEGIRKVYMSVEDRLDTKHDDIPQQDIK